MNMKNITFLLLTFIIVFASCQKAELELLQEETAVLNTEDVFEKGQTYPYSLEISRDKGTSPINILFNENPVTLNKYGDLVSLNWAVIEHTGDLMNLQNYENITNFNLWEDKSSQVSKVDIALTTVYENITLEYNFCVNVKGNVAEFGDCINMKNTQRDYDPDGNTFILVLPAVPPKGN